jgi:pyrroline-5-carboxylate reductase
MNIGFIGGGKMAEAMLAALIDKHAAAPGEIVVGEADAGRRAHLAQRYGVRVTDRNPEVPAEALVVVLAVKPQQLDDVLREIAPALTAGHLIVSIAAGKRTDRIEALLPQGRVVRVMPNICCLAGAGMSVFTRGARAQAGHGRAVADLLACCGRTLELPEEQFDAVTALSGSGPAFLAYLLDRLVDGAVAEGLKREDALLLAGQTMLGTARLLLDLKLQPAELAAAVTSQKGTTAEGRRVLETEAVAGVLRDTIRAAARRSRELSQS